jgi:hypothetical protein
MSDAIAIGTALARSRRRTLFMTRIALRPGTWTCEEAGPTKPALWQTPRRVSPSKVGPSLVAKSESAWGVCQPWRLGALAMVRGGTFTPLTGPTSRRRACGGARQVETSEAEEFGDPYERRVKTPYLSEILPICRLSAVVYDIAHAQASSSRERRFCIDGIPLSLLGFPRSEPLECW